MYRRAPRPDARSGESPRRPSPFADRPFAPPAVRRSPDVPVAPAGTAVPSSSPSPAPGLLIQRSMKDVMGQQYRREEEIGSKDYRKEAGTGRYTTVGFEWDIAKTAEHSDETPNPLQGLSHVEVAESELRWNALPYLLETDSGNVLEMVTPPFYIRIQEAGRALPDPADVQEVITATREGLTAILREGMTIQELVKADWSDFELGSWKGRNLKKTIDWSNWSPRSGIAQAQLPALSGVGDIALSEVTLGSAPQINVAVDPATYEELEDASQSRIESSDLGGAIKVAYDGAFTNIMRIIERLAENPRQLAFFRQCARVLAQQYAVPSILRLSELQRQGWEGGAVSSGEITGPANTASYVKDTSNLWLKSDLVSYGLGILKREDWAAVGVAIQTLEERYLNKTGLPKVPNLVTTELAKQQVTERALQVTARLKEQAEILSGTSAEEFGERELALIQSLKAEPRGLNEHNPNLLGVRQDTFINPEVMRNLGGKLNIGSWLYVIEARNTGGKLDWLKPGKKKKKGGAIEDLPLLPPSDLGALFETAPLVDADGGILPEVRGQFIAAYRHDLINSNSYLTEGEGHIVANELGIAVRLYRGAQPPEGFETVENDGGGNCLIHSLVQAQRASRSRPPQDAQPGFIARVRNLISQRMEDEVVLPLCAAAVMGRIIGQDEPGLGDQMLGLLGHPSIARAAQRFHLQEASKSKEKSKESEKSKASSSKSGGGGGQAPLVMPQLGNGVPLADQAVLHIGGAHYVMIRRRRR